MLRNVRHKNYTFIVHITWGHFSGVFALLRFVGLGSNKQEYLNCATFQVFILSSYCIYSLLYKKQEM